MPKQERGKGRGRPINLTLTDPQKKLLQAIEAYIARHGMSPTMREMSDELGQGVANVFKLVQRLERNGYITRVPGKSRSLAVVRSANEEAIIGLVSIPLVGTVVAGHPLLAQENVLGELLVDATTVRTGRHFALKVMGQSMIDAGIGSGDVVIVRQQPLADHRDIVVALLNDEATVKRLHYRQGQVSLLPENPRFKPIPVGPDDDLRIVGKVVAVRRG
jgi:repressor LexA